MNLKEKTVEKHVLYTGKIINLRVDDAELPDPYYTDIDNNYDIPGWDLAKAATEDDKDPDADAIKAVAEKLNPGTPFAAK